MPQIHVQRPVRLSEDCPSGSMKRNVNETVSRKGILRTRGGAALEKERRNKKGLKIYDHPENLVTSNLSNKKKKRKGGNLRSSPPQ